MKRINLMVASTIGTTLEWYDFFVFGACAILVFDKTFFVSDNPLVGTLLVAWHLLGRLSWPGRSAASCSASAATGSAARRCWSSACLMMGFGTFAIGMLPTYAAIGIYAPIGLVVLRIFQGIAVGGEATGRHPDHRRIHAGCQPRLLDKLHHVRRPPRQRADRRRHLGRPRHLWHRCLRRVGLAHPVLHLRPARHRGLLDPAPRRGVPGVPGLCAKEP